MSKVAKYIVDIPNTKKKNNTFYFRLVIPSDLQQFYDYKTEIKFTLKTKDPLIAKRKVEPLIAKYKAEFESFRTTGSGVRIAALNLLEQNNLKPISLQYQPEATHITPELAEIGFNDSPLELFRQKLEDEYAGSTDAVTNYAFAILKGSTPITLSEAKELALQKEGADRKTRSSINAAFALVRKLAGTDIIKDIHKPTLQGRIFNETTQSGKTVKRYFNKVYTAINKLLDLHNITDIKNPLTNLDYPKPSQPVKRTTLSISELQRLYQLLNTKQGKAVDLLSILIFTGMRIAEVACLKVSDIHLNTEHPHISLNHNERRSLKNEQSVRLIPITDITLSKLKQLSTTTSDYLFTYKDGNGASANVNKWLRNNGFDATAHSLRHSFKELLIEVETPEVIIEAICGWQSSLMVRYYGKRPTLDKTTPYTIKAASIINAD